MSDQEETIAFQIESSESGERVDKILASRFGHQHSRNYFQFLIDHKLVLLNGKPIKKREKLEEGSQLTVTFVPTEKLDLAPEDIPLDILFEDEHLIAINKPSGMVVHPAPGNWTGTFVNALLHHCDLQIDGDSLRPGIVHRLDQRTTGVLIAAKNALTQQRLVDLFSQRKVQKEYIAICLGNPGTRVIEAPIGRHPVKRKEMCVRDTGGRSAKTEIKLMATDGDLSVVLCKPVSGRTHQIRVHLKHVGAPILGDGIYGSLSSNRKWDARRQMLHAKKLTLNHPITEELLEINAPVPQDMTRIIDTIEKRQK